MILEKARLLVLSLFTHPLIDRCYAEGDKLSSSQTKHDKGHGLEVTTMGLRVVEIVKQKFPNFLDEWSEEVVLKPSLFLHDIGRCIDVDKHDTAGARWVLENLPHITYEGETLSDSDIKRIARMVAYHRSNRYKGIMEKDAGSHKGLADLQNDPVLHILLIADKCVGDEERVRPGRARLLRFLTKFRAAKLWDINPFRKGGIHDRVNFAIKNASLDPVDDTMVLRFKLDTRVCKPHEVYNLYGDRFACCVIAAGKLGFNFELEFNGVRYVQVAEGDWLPRR